MKKNYLITVDVLSAKGFQQFEVMARSESEAIKLFADGKGEFIAEEIDVTSIGKPRAELNE